MAERRKARTSRRGWAALGASVAAHAAILAAVSVPTLRASMAEPLDTWGASVAVPETFPSFVDPGELVEVETALGPEPPEPLLAPTAVPTPAPRNAPEAQQDVPKSVPPRSVERAVASRPRTKAASAKPASAPPPPPAAAATQAGVQPVSPPAEPATDGEQDEYWWAVPTSSSLPPPPAPRAPGLSGQPPPVATRASDARDEADDESAEDPGLPAGVKRLVSAFTRSIPYYNYADPAWDRLPLGKVGSMDLTFVVDDQGRIVEVVTRGSPPPVLQRVRKRSVFALERGRFAISRSEVRAGTQTLRVECFLSERPVGKFVPPAFHFTPPRDGRPGTAAVHLESGRYVEMRVTPDPR